MIKFFLQSIFLPQRLNLVHLVLFVFCFFNLILLFSVISPSSYRLQMDSWPCICLFLLISFLKSVSSGWAHFSDTRIYSLESGKSLFPKHYPRSACVIIVYLFLFIDFCISMYIFKVENVLYNLERRQLIPDTFVHVSYKYNNSEKKKQFLIESIQIINQWSILIFFF